MPSGTMLSGTMPTGTMPSGTMSGRNNAWLGTVPSRYYAPSGNRPSATRNYAMPNGTMPSSNYA